MSASFDFKSPDLFTAGAVGPPGQRVFYFQAREAGTLVTLKVEKEQVAALAEHLAGLLEKLPGAARGADRPGDLALIEPVAEEWAVGTLGVGYDEAADRVVIVAHELLERAEAGESAAEPGEAEGGAEHGGATARFSVSRAQVAAFVERARALIKAGRPACILCGRPKNPGGHVCARSNGHAPS